MPQWQGGPSIRRNWTETATALAGACGDGMGISTIDVDEAHGSAKQPDALVLSVR